MFVPPPSICCKYDQCFIRTKLCLTKMEMSDMTVLVDQKLNKH